MNYSKNLILTIIAAAAIYAICLTVLISCTDDTDTGLLKFNSDCTIHAVTLCTVTWPAGHSGYPKEVKECENDTLYKLGNLFYSQNLFRSIDGYCAKLLPGCGSILEIDDDRCYMDLKGIQVKVTGFANCVGGYKVYKMDGGARFIRDNGLIRCDIFDSATGCIAEWATGAKSKISESYTDSAGLTHYRIGLHWYNQNVSEFQVVCL